MDSSERNFMRDAVSKEYGFSLWKHYAEKEACVFLRKDVSTLKRWRKKRLVEFKYMGEKEIRYFGYQIADMLIDGVKRDG